MEQKRKVGRPRKYPLPIRKKRGRPLVKSENDKACTVKEAMFAEEYMLDFNKKNAARRIGHPKSKALQWGNTYYCKPHVKNYIKRLMSERREKIRSSKDRIIHELERIAFFDIRGMYREDGGFKSVLELNDDQAAVISEIEFRRPPIGQLKETLIEEIDKNKPKRKDGSTNTKKDQYEIAINASIKKFKRYSKMDALKMLGTYHGVRLDASQDKQQPIFIPDTTDQMSLEKIARNLDKHELESFQKLLIKASTSAADNKQSTGGKVSKSLH